MIDFKELPKDGIKFEQLIRELLIKDGFEVHWTGIGPDGDKDLIIFENLNGPLSSYKRTWLISCKHFANSNKSVGRDHIGDITSACRTINAEGFILACSTQPTAPAITYLEEISRNQNIITKFWDSIEIEKKLLTPNGFSLIHTFFPKSSKNYKWKIYNTFAPDFWAAHDKGYFFYMSSRHSNTYPDLKDIEEIVEIVEQIPKYLDPPYGFDSHLIRLRAFYYDDKHSTFTVFLDYLYSRRSEEKVMAADILLDKIFDIFQNGDHRINFPDWDVKFNLVHTGSDSFQMDHKDYYEPYIQKFAKGNSRKEFLHDMAYTIKLFKNL